MCLSSLQPKPYPTNQYLHTTPTEHSTLGSGLDLTPEDEKLFRTTTAKQLVAELRAYEPSAEVLNRIAKVFKELGKAPSLPVRLVKKPIDQLDDFKALPDTLRDLPAIYKNGVVWLKKGESFVDQRTHLLYLLLSACHEKEYEELEDKLIAGKFDSAEAYTRAKVRISYESLVECLQIMHKLGWNGGKTNFLTAFDEDCKFQANCPKDFEHYYAHFLTDEHHEYYKNIWKKFANADNASK